MNKPLRARTVQVSFDAISDALHLPKNCSIRFIQQDGAFSVRIGIESDEFDEVAPNQRVPEFNPVFKMLGNGQVELEDWGKPLGPQ